MAKPYSRGLVPSLPQSVPEFLNIELLKVERAFDTVEVDIAAGGGGGGGTGTTTNALTINSSGTGHASPATFDGSAAVAISYNTVGAAAASHSHSESDITGLTTDLAAKQPLDGTLTAFAALAWSAGVQVPVLTAADTFSLKTVGALAGNLLDKASGDSLYQPTGSYLTANQSITLSGDVTGTGTTAITVTLAASGVTAGTYTNATVTFDAKGRATAASSGSGRVLLGEIAADGSKTTFTFSSIASTYKRLVVEAWFTIPANATFSVRCNNDSSAIYQMQRTGHENGAVNLQQLLQTSWNPTAATFNTGVAVDFELSFGNYASANKKLARMMLCAGTTTSGQLAVAPASLLYDSATAVSRLDFIFSSAPTAGQIRLYGIA